MIRGSLASPVMRSEACRIALFGNPLIGESFKEKENEACYYKD